MSQWPVFTLRETRTRISPNPAIVSAIYESSSGYAEIYTLDCSRAEDAWDVTESFDYVLDVISRHRDKEETT